MHVSSVLVYGGCSVAIIWSNKVILTEYGLSPVSLMFLQNAFTVIAMLIMHVMGYIKLKLPNLSTFNLLIGTSIINVMNTFVGLGGTALINAAMFTTLRRIGIGMTMILETLFLGINHKSSIKVSIYLIIIGTIIAALDDLTFNLVGYTYTMINNALTAGSQIVTKKYIDKHNENGKEMVCFYTSIIGLVTCSIYLYVYQTELILTVKSITMFYNNLEYMNALIASTILGLILNLSINWCIDRNDPLTLSVTGSIKNILVMILSCIGFIGRDYKYSICNFIGLQVATIGSIMYMYMVAKVKTS